MKYVLIGILSTFSLISCFLNLEDDKTTNKENFVIAYDDCVMVDEDLEVCFAKIVSDSRCPENVECVWEGQAEVEIKTIFKKDLINNFVLIQRAGQPELGDTTIAGYHYLLTKVNPYPIDPVVIDSSDYDIEITITKI